MVFEKVREILSSQFGVDKDMIDEKTDILNDLGADSLDIVELMMSLEEEYGLLITDDMIADIKTTGELVVLLKEKIK